MSLVNFKSSFDKNEFINLREFAGDVLKILSDFLNLEKQENRKKGDLLKSLLSCIFQLFKINNESIPFFPDLNFECAFQDTLSKREFDSIKNNPGNSTYDRNSAFSKLTKTNKI